MTQGFSFIHSKNNQISNRKNNNSNILYHDLEVSPFELRPSVTLTIGQCFHWQVVENDGDSTIEKNTSLSSAWRTYDANKWVGILQTRGED